MELLAGLLAYDPENRMTAEEALKHRFFSEATLGAIQLALAGASSLESDVAEASGSQPPEDKAS
jgi:serine/threonine protein kinase